MGVSWDGVDASLKAGYEALSQAVYDAGGSTTLTSTIRSQREQSFLWDRYQRGLSALPAAPPGHSAHEYGWAFDMVVSPSEWQFDVGSLWTSWGGAYGGKRDPVHFELKGAGAYAYALGEQGAQPAVTTTNDPTTDGSIFLLPTRWRAFIYSAEDFGISFIPGVGYIQLIAGLLKLGYGDSEILNLLTQPVETLHAQFPNLPF